MHRMLWVGLGGFVGAILRYVMTGWIQGWTKSVTFPHGTLAVNLMGCFIIGLLSQLLESRSAVSVEARLSIFIGLLGAFTTFSTFGNETLDLLRKGTPCLPGATLPYTSCWAWGWCGWDACWQS